MPVIRVRRCARLGQCFQIFSQIGQVSVAYVPSRHVRAVRRAVGMFSFYDNKAEGFEVVFAAFLSLFVLAAVCAFHLTHLHRPANVVGVHCLHSHHNPSASAHNVRFIIPGENRSTVCVSGKGGSWWVLLFCRCMPENQPVEPRSKAPERSGEDCAPYDNHSSQDKPQHR
jgi:hypothetical protein